MAVGRPPGRTVPKKSGVQDTGHISPTRESLCSGLSFRSLSTLNDGTGNAPKISLGPLLVTEHYFVSTSAQKGAQGIAIAA
jgi:hypothetical protein